MPESNLNVKKMILSLDKKRKLKEFKERQIQIQIQHTKI